MNRTDREIHLSIQLFLFYYIRKYTREIWVVRNVQYLFIIILLTTNNCNNIISEKVQTIWMKVREDLKVRREPYLIFIYKLDLFYIYIYNINLYIYKCSPQTRVPFCSIFICFPHFVHVETTVSLLRDTSNVSRTRWKTRSLSIRIFTRFFYVEKDDFIASKQFKTINGKTKWQTHTRGRSVLENLFADFWPFLEIFWFPRQIKFGNFGNFP